MNKNRRSGRPSMFESVRDGLIQELYIRWFTRQATIRELCQQFEIETGQRIDPSTLSRWFRRLHPRNK